MRSWGEVGEFAQSISVLITNIEKGAKWPTYVKSAANLAGCKEPKPVAFGWLKRLFGARS
jgi:hypothetical protein